MTREQAERICSPNLTREERFAIADALNYQAGHFDGLAKSRPLSPGVFVWTNAAAELRALTRKVLAADPLAEMTWRPTA